MNNIESSLIRTIAESNLSEIAELGIDSILTEGLLKEIPILSSLSGLAKTGAAVRDYLYLKKILRFLAELNNIPIGERQKFADNLGNNEKERARAGENLLLIIDRLDNVNKPEILGRMYRDHILGNISKSELMSLQKALDLFNLELSAELNEFYSGSNGWPSNDVLQFFAGCGLASMDFGGVIGSVGGYHHNKLGKLFLQYVV